MKNLSKFDKGVLIAFVVVALLGGGAWFYLSQELSTAQQADADANADFVKFSTAVSTSNQAASDQGKIVVGVTNEKTLQANIEMLKAQIGPLIQAKLAPKENILGSIGKKDPVAWKADLNDMVNRLRNDAKIRNVNIPPNFYFGFSRYVGQSPGDEQTEVLSKQMTGIEELATILIDAQVKKIGAVRRTYEEEPHTSAEAGPNTTADPDRLSGYAITVAGNVYTAYPFEVDFETSPENLRVVVDKLIQSPYVFVVRALTIQNDHPESPVMSDLQKLAGPPAASFIETSPGEVAAAAPTKGPQYFFGEATLKVKARIDMIEWKAQPDK
ncbi:MAG TPA: Amuc_1100 family pilus-like protein [Candidatus Methylacidiphilales bacterium]|jgi:hypothetical protein|nr:Amuc_1100 family pilus-like protein [Candidatus Methylacidiphilales bacterium]